MTLCATCKHNISCNQQQPTSSGRTCAAKASAGPMLESGRAVNVCGSYEETGSGRRQLIDRGGRIG